MSSDGKEPGATWQGPPQSSRGQSLNQGQQDDPAPAPGQQGQEAILQWHTPVVADEEEAPDMGSEAVEAPAPGPPKRLAHYFTLIAVPLFLGILTCLIVLPLVAANRAVVPPAGLWLVALVIILVVIAQVCASFYVDENSSLRALTIMGGISLFLLVGVFTLSGLGAGLILLAVLLTISAIMARFCMHSVTQGYVDLAYAFGKYSRTLSPGLNLLLPWEKVGQHLYVEETQWLCPAQRVQMSRDEDLILSAVISYRLLPEDAYLAATQVDRWEERMRELFKTTIQSIATTFSPDDFIAWPHGLHQQAATDITPRWERVNAYLLRQVQDRVALWGVQINQVQIRDITLAPHEVAMTGTEPVAGAPAPDQRTVQPAVATPRKEATMPGQPDPAPSRPDNAAPPAVHIKEEALIKAYQEVQNGNITDPDTIRTIADKFDEIARNPQANQTVSFDAARAALNLYRQASRYEELLGGRTIYNDATKPDWMARRASDENLMAGG